MSQTRCDICGLSEQFCDYFDVGDEKKTFCGTCAESLLTVFKITQKQESGGFIEFSIDKAIESLRCLIDEAPEDESYSIIKTQITRLESERLPEFQGF